MTNQRRRSGGDLHFDRDTLERLVLHPNHKSALNVTLLRVFREGPESTWWVLGEDGCGGRRKLPNFRESLRLAIAQRW